jgi:hypothetical protein
VVHSSGTFTSKTYFDEAGNPTHNVLTVSDFHVEWSNPISGKSLTTPLAGPFVTTYGPDGSATITVPGNDGRFVVASEGIVFGTVGLLIYNVEDLEDPSSSRSSSPRGSRTRVPSPRCVRDLPSCE